MTDGFTNEDLEPWFAGRESGVVLLFKVNRRPMAQASLFGQRTEDVLSHLAQVLLFGEPVETGRRNRRLWRLGNRELDESAGYLAGQIGYERPDQRPTDRYDPELQAWTDAVDVVDATARAPFVYYKPERTLAVLRHPTFSESTIPAVFSTLLNRGERQLVNPTTEWEVEPKLDEIDFLDWLRTADSVLKVSFTAKLPNPDGEAEFEPVLSRLEDRKAKALREIMEARDPDLGLEGVDQDPIARAYMAMAAKGNGNVRGERKSSNRVETYNQRDKVKRGYIGPLPSTWPQLILMIVGFLQAEHERRKGGRQ